MATAGYNQTISSSGTYIFDSSTDGGKCTKIMVACNPSSSVTLLVNISGLHSLNEYFPIYPGGSQIFQLNYNGITRVFAKGDSGTATADWGVVEKTIL
jgi:hypothetical protein